MAKGIYQRYKCVDNLSYAYTSSAPVQGEIWETGTFATTFTFNKLTGLFSLSGSISGKIIMAYNVGYEAYKTPVSVIAQYVGKGAGYNGLAIVSKVILTSNVVHDYSRGTYLTDIIADYGSLPAEGRHTDGYWYVFIKMASDVKVNVGGIWRDAPTAYVNVGGIMRPQSELKANIGGIWR